MTLTSELINTLRGLSYSYENTGDSPVNIGEMRAWCRIGSSEEDATLSAAIDEVIDEVENAYNFSIIDKTVTLIALSHPKEIRLPFSPVKEVVSAKSGDDDVNYRVIGDTIVLGSNGNDIEIVYKTGWDTLPLGIKQSGHGRIDKHRWYITA
jgi:hypothetical protein